MYYFFFIKNHVNFQDLSFKYQIKLRNSQAKCLRKGI